MMSVARANIGNQAGDRSWNMVRKPFFAFLLGATGLSSGFLGLMTEAATAPMQPPDICAAPTLVTAVSAQQLPHTSMALSQKHNLRIVAVGSSSTEGAGASGPTKTYPAQLDAILEQRFPGTKIEVINKG